MLPTNGTAKFFSPLGVDDYIKKSSIIYYSKEALAPVKDDIIRFAEAESLTAHANSIKVRFEKRRMTMADRYSEIQRKTSETDYYNETRD